MLLRASQLGAAIFWVALLGCGIKDGALTLVVLIVWLVKRHKKKQATAAAARGAGGVQFTSAVAGHGVSKA